MKQKVFFLLIIALVLLSVGVLADSLSDISTTMSLSSNSIYGGESVLANFSFNYLNPPNTKKNSALIIKLNLTSNNQINFPVGKGDFKINGYAKKCGFNFLGECIVWDKEVPFSCSEINTTTINNSRYGVNVLDVPNGTFYCFNESNDLTSNEHDNIFLNITPNSAIWPSNYTINASLFYLNDTLSPFVNITNKNYFNQYFSKLSNINVAVNISDGVGLKSHSIFSTISSSPQITSSSYYINSSDGIYHFPDLSLNGIYEGNYNLTVYATDRSEEHTSELQSH